MKFLSAVIFAMIAASGFAQNAGNETIAAGRDKPCNSFNNDCQSCIQYSNTGVVPAHTCDFCPSDGICHTIGSKLNPCSNAECISLSNKSSCEKKTIQDCSAAVAYGKN